MTPTKSMTHVRGLFLAAILLTLTACGNFGKDDQQLLTEAATYLEQGDINAAIIEYKNVLQRNSDNAEARYRLAEIYLEFHDFSSAEKEFRHAARIGWDQAEACYGLTRALLGQGKYKELLADCAIEETFPIETQADLTALHAAALAGLDKQYEALQKLQRAERLQADAQQVLQTRIEFFLIEDNLAAADKVISQALALYPESLVFMLQRAGRLVQQGNDAAASELLQTVVDSDPSGHITGFGRRARLTLARLKIAALDFQTANTLIKPLYGNDPETSYLGSLIAYREGDFDLAEQRVLKVIKQAPNYVPAMLLYGAINYSQEEFEQATYYLSKYVAAEPANLGARKLLSQAHMKLGQFEEARTSLASALDDDKNDAELLALVGVSALRSGNSKTGILNLEQAVAAAPDSLPLRGELARAYLASGDIKRAVEELETILQGDNHPQEAEILLVLAHMRAGSNEKAVSTVNNLLDNNPSDPVILTLAGHVQEASENRQAARTLYNKALALAPNYTLATLSLGRLEEQSGSMDKAITLYKASAESSPGDTRPILALARIAESKGDTEAAINWLQEASERDISDLKARIALGEYYLRAGKPELASPSIAEAIKIAPHDATALLLHARVLMAQGSRENALEPLNELIEAHPESPVVHALLGENLLRLERYDEAREHMQLVLTSYPNSREALALAAELELRSGNFKAALQHGKQLQTIAPDNSAGYEVAGNVYMVERHYQKASEAFAAAWEREPTASLAIKLSESLKPTSKRTESVTPLLDWLKDHPDNLAVRQMLATTWMELGENDKAIQAYIMVLDKAPDSLVTLNNLAWLYQLENNPLALETARRAHQIDANDPGVLDTYGWLLVQHDDAEQGRALLARALQQLPDVPEVQYHYAVALLQAGETEEAIKRLEQALSSDSEFTGREDAQQLLDKHRS